MEEDKKRPINILLVEDSKADQLYYRSVIQATGITIALQIAETTEQVTHHLSQTEQPDLILLDLYLRPTSGKEWLEQIKNNRALKHIPVIILTSSEHEQDINDCYEKGAHLYVVKEYHLEKNLQKMKKLFSRNWKEKQPREKFVLNLEENNHLP